jgi:hypothetical protein
MNDLTTTVVGTKLHKDEVLTELCKEGHVRKFYMRSGDIILHCDDDVLYVYET